MDHSRKIIWEIGFEWTSNHPTEYGKCKKGGFLHGVAQTILKLDLDHGNFFDC